MSEKPKYPIDHNPSLESSRLPGIDDDSHWVLAGLPEEDCQNWRTTFELHYGPQGPGSATWPYRALRLWAYGWTPADLDDALSSRGRSLPLPLNPEIPHRGPIPRDKPMNADQVESASALAWEVVNFVEYERFSPTYARDRYLWELSRVGWNHSQLGSLFGLTKQRVQQLMKQIGREEGKPRRGIARD